MLKKLKSLFIIEEESKGSKDTKSQVDRKPTRAAKEQKQNTGNPANKPVIRMDETNLKGKVTTRFLNILLGAMDKNNLEGFDYLEFKQSLQSLSKMEMDEATQFKSAFAMAQTMGADAQALKKTANHYLKVLADEEHKFEEALANQREKQILGKEQNFKTLSKKIAEKNAQIQKMNEEILNAKKKMSALEEELAQTKIKVESTKSDFQVTYQTLVDQIQSDIQKMNQYLK